MSNTMTGFCESFAKVRESIRERRGALPRGRFICSQVCRTIFFTFPTWWRSPATTKEPQSLYLHYLLHVLVYTPYVLGFGVNMQDYTSRKFAKAKHGVRESNFFSREKALSRWKEFRSTTIYNFCGLKVLLPRFLKFYSHQWHLVYYFQETDA